MRSKVSIDEIQRHLRQEDRKKKIIKHEVTDDPIDGYDRSLYKDLMLPSYVHGYSLAIEYMTKWFERKFPKDYFKSIYIDGSHVIDGYKHFSKMMVKGENPRARIIPRVEYEYDMENLDFYQGPSNIYLRRTRLQDSFFKDRERNLYLAMIPRALRMDFNYKVRVNTRSQQLDLFNQMELNFRVGATQAEDISVDFHIPKVVMLDIADKAGFKIVHGEVIDIIDFLHYLNLHSELPFLFKLRAINHKAEFFVRLSNLYTHIAIKDKLEVDDGERDGKLDTNFHIEMNAILTMPIPHFYAYYNAKCPIQDIEVREPDEGTVAIYTVNLLDIPQVDENGWNQACCTDYLIDDNDIMIDLSSLFSGDNVISKTINHDLTLGVSPTHFLNVKIYRDEDIAREVPFNINWKSKLITFDTPMKQEVLHIVIYHDRSYINELATTMNDYNKLRVGIDK